MELLQIGSRTTRIRTQNFFACINMFAFLYFHQSVHSFVLGVPTTHSALCLPFYTHTHKKKTRKKKKTKKKTKKKKSEFFIVIIIIKEY